MRHAPCGGEFIDADPAERHVRPLTPQVVDDGGERSRQRRARVVTRQGSGGEQGQQETQGLLHLELPAVRLLPTQPDQVVAQPGQWVMPCHATGSDRHGTSSTDELRVEVHIAVAAGASLVPDEAVAHARRHQQKVAGREHDLLVVCHEERLPQEHPGELELVDDAGPHPCPPADSPRPTDRPSPPRHPAVWSSHSDKHSASSSIPPAHPLGEHESTKQ